MLNEKERHLAGLVGRPVICLFCLLLAGALQAEAMDGDAREGLVLAYDFEGDVRDTSGGNHHGTVHGDPGFAPGRSGQCLVLDGEGDFIDTGTPFPELCDTFTVALWVKPAATQNRYADILGNHAGGGITGCVLQQNDSRVNEFGFGYGNGTVYVDLPKIRLVPDRWQHLAMVKTRDAMFLYLNGLRVGVARADGPMAVSTVNFRVGLGFENPARCFRGAVDELRIWNRPLAAIPVEVSMADKVDAFARSVCVTARPSAADGFFAAGDEPEVVFQIDAGAVPSGIDEIEICCWVRIDQDDVPIPPVMLKRAADFKAGLLLPKRPGFYTVTYHRSFIFKGTGFEIPAGTFRYAVPPVPVAAEAVTKIASGPSVCPPAISLDGDDWLLATDPDNAGTNKPVSHAKQARVPGIIQEVFPGYHGVAWYWRDFECPAHPLPDGRVLLCFDAVDYLAQVWVNDVPVGKHEGGETPFELDVTRAVRTDGPNRLAVRVLNPTTHPIDGITLAETPHRNKAVPYRNGASFNTGGITESVALRLVPAVRVADLYARPDPDTGEVTLQATVINTLKAPVQGRLLLDISTALTAERITAAGLDRTFAPGQSIVAVPLSVKAPRRWQLDDPFLYRARAHVSTTPERGGHAHSVRFGFRDFRVERGFFRLNGKRIFVRSSHTGNHCPVGQIIPPAEAPDLLRRDLLNAKACGFNMVRFIAGMAHPWQLDLCDEIGLMVYEECYAAWLLADSPHMAERFDASLAGMVRRDRNHPCVVIWGLLNEERDGPVFRHAVDSLNLVRFLDDTRLVLLQSGRWDGRFEIGTVSNPGGRAWEHVWGAEDPAYNRPFKWASGGYALGAGDAHVYTGAPLSAAEENLIRTLGKSMKPVFLSEGGIGSVMHAIRELRCYEQAGANLAAEDAVLMRGMAEGFAADWKRFGMEDTYAFPEDMLTESQRHHCRQRRHFFDLVRSNPDICGYNLTGLLDHGMTGEGLWRFWREWKPGIFDTLRDGWAPVRWCLFVSPMHGYVGRPFQVEAVLANEDVLAPGTYPVCCRILGPAGVAWERRVSVEIPAVEEGADGPLALPVLSETVTLEGEPGRYVLAVSMEKGGAPTGGRLDFQLTQPAKYPKLAGSAFCIGLEAPVRKWLEARGLKCRDFPVGGPQQAKRWVILLGGPPPDDAWPAVARHIARGSTALFLTPASLSRKGNPVGGLLLEQKGRFHHFHDWLYHKECVARNHAVFTGLPAGLMDWHHYGPVITRGVFDGQPTPDDTMAAAFALGYPCPGGHMSALMMGAYRFGAGRFVVNTLGILPNVDAHPAADRLLLNLVRYAQSETDKPLGRLPDDFEKRLARVLPGSQAPD